MDKKRGASSMKKIINGRQYDTDKAQYMGGDNGGEGFSHWSEELYQKRTGEFFLYGEGGARTKYAQALSDNSWSGGEKIIPLSIEAAQAWAEKHLDGDEYEKIFGEVAEDGSKKTVSFSLPESTIERIRSRAAAESISMSELITRLVEA
jgi:hypothetical protein